MLSRLAKNDYVLAVLFALIALLLLAGISSLFGLSGEICDQNGGSQNGGCPRYNFVLVGLWKIIEIANWASPAITALATIAIAAFTWTLYRATTEQGKLTKEALVVSTRAFVFLENFQCPFTQVAEGALDPTISGLLIIPNWKNSGETPSKNLELRVTCRVIDGELPDDFEYFYQDDPLLLMIGPKSTECSEPIVVLDEAANRALGGETNVYVWGRADYSDVFANTKPRFTTFCSRLSFLRRSDDIVVGSVPYGPYNGTDADT